MGARGPKRALILFPYTFVSLVSRFRSGLYWCSSCSHSGLLSLNSSSLLGSSLLLKKGLGVDLLLRLQNSNNIIERNLGSQNSFRILWQENTNSDSYNSLTHHNVSDGHVGVYLSSMSSLDHVSISELHGLGTLSTELSGDNNLTSLGAGLHDETDDSITGTTDGKSSQQLVLETLSLGLSTKSTVLNTLSIKLNGTIIEVESLLDNRGQFTDALSLLSEDVLGTSGTDNDVGTVGGGAYLNSSVTVLGELGNEELVELRVEASISDKLALGRHFGAIGHHLENWLSC
mmetsp:Transcript_12557/g.18306  ORF Transcript_12557/g.18306 Transcript_12557/m.18306 type:complete len:288 (+) Transcript_12557:38-901(+)